MTGNLRHYNNVINQNGFTDGDVRRVKKNNAKTVEAEEALPLVHESCKCSTFSLAVAAGGLLVFAGIILYALLVWFEIFVSDIKYHLNFVVKGLDL